MEEKCYEPFVTRLAKQWLKGDSRRRRFNMFKQKHLNMWKHFLMVFKHVFNGVKHPVQNVLCLIREFIMVFIANLNSS